MTPPEHSRGLAGRIRGARLAVLDPGAHDLVHEFPDRVSEELLNFLSDSSAP
ncbi:MAG TPA: hypothetical protein VKG01_12410 [Thermoanaerobaculia bacterium]|nr:hypothetical protein [Thermoanaerobaculia bacterium]